MLARFETAKLRRESRQTIGLLFSRLLPAETIKKALGSLAYRKRVFCPLVTVWSFLQQVLGPDASCRAMVAKIPAHRLENGEQTVQPSNGRIRPSSQAASSRCFPEDLQMDHRRSRAERRGQ